MSFTEIEYHLYEAGQYETAITELMNGDAYLPLQISTSRFDLKGHIKQSNTNVCVLQIENIVIAFKVSSTTGTNDPHSSRQMQADQFCEGSLSPSVEKLDYPKRQGQNK